MKQVTRELQLFEDDQPGATTDNDLYIEIENPHLLFDVPLRETLEAFVDALDTYYQPELIMNTKSLSELNGTDPLFMFEDAIDHVLGLESKYHDACAPFASEQVFPGDHDSWRSLASTWLWQYLLHYNRILYPNNSDELHRNMSKIRSLSRTGVISKSEAYDKLHEELDEASIFQH